MGLFDRIFGKKSNDETSVVSSNTQHQSVEENQSVVSDITTPTNIKSEDKKYYRPDSYYTDKAFENTSFERSVITFEQRKKTCIPSTRGLYVGEILLLEYVSYGNYPNPSSGYPGLWWFEYGIRDVNAALASLKNRGFITMGTATQALSSYTIPQLKEILVANLQPITGKKADLIKRISENVSEAGLLSSGVQPKYVLTELGLEELTENAYVPYMHKHHKKTSEDTTLSPEFNVWSINKLLGTGSKENWKSVVDDQDIRLHKWYLQHSIDELQEYEKNSVSLKEIIGNDRVQQTIVMMQESVQLNRIFLAEEYYQIDSDLGKIIRFWENLWSNEGLITTARWGYRLGELYFENGEYDKARKHCEMIIATRPSETQDAEKILSKIKKHSST